MKFNKEKKQNFKVFIRMRFPKYLTSHSEPQHLKIYIKPLNKKEVYK